MMNYLKNLLKTKKIRNKYIDEDFTKKNRNHKTKKHILNKTLCNESIKQVRDYYKGGE